MKHLNILSLIAGLALSFSAYYLAPESVAIHFGIDGHPDSWASSLTNLYFSLGIYVFIMLPMFLLPSYIKKIPIRMLNIPHKEFWLEPQNKNLLYEKLEKSFYPFTFATTILFVLIQSLALSANLSTPVTLNQSIVWSALAAYLAYAAYWCYLLFKTLTPPNENS